jgi:predicted dithiol-disulfide oxidoreductase (DUF899 family)
MNNPTVMAALSLGVVLGYAVVLSRSRVNGTCAGCTLTVDAIVVAVVHEREHDRSVVC